MLRDSLDALRGLLKANFPEVSRIYVSSMPTGFVRPSFFIDFVARHDEHLSSGLYGVRLTWQIVYFAPEDGAGNPNVFAQLEVAQRLKTLLMEGRSITGPSGKTYHVIETDGGPRDSEVYITVRLQAEERRPEPQFDLMGDIDHVYKEG